MKSLKAIVFDFDGVIGDTFEFHYKMVNEFLGTNLTMAEFKNIHDGNFFTSVPNEMKNANWEDYRDYIYEQFKEIEMKKEIKYVLEKLNRKYELFIISSGGYRNIKDFFENNGFTNIFGEILGQEFHRSKIEKFKHIFNKYSLKCDECLFITDTIGDLVEANKVRVKCIGVTWGYHDRERMMGKGFVNIVDDRLMLVDAIERIKHIKKGS